MFKTHSNILDEYTRSDYVECYTVAISSDRRIMEHKADFPMRACEI